MGNGSDPVEYFSDESFSALFYDFIENHCRDTLAEVEFYREEAARCPTPVLEAGCGTGRITWPLAAAGVEVVGVDISGQMLRLAQDKAAALPPDAAARVRFLRADVRHLDLDERYGLVIAPFRVFNHMLTVHDQRRFLGALRRHVTPDGRVVIDAMQPPWEQPDGSGRAPECDCLVVNLAAFGVELEWRLEERAVDPLEQRSTVRVRYTLRRPSGAVLREKVELLTQRWTSPLEMRHLAELCGLRVVAEYQDARRSPPRTIGDRVWVLEPMGPPAGQAPAPLP